MRASHLMLPPLFSVAWLRCLGCCRAGRVASLSCSTLHVCRCGANRASSQMVQRLQPRRIPGCPWIIRHDLYSFIQS